MLKTRLLAGGRVAQHRCWAWRLMLVGATTMFAELQDALDTIWHVPARPLQGWLSLGARAAAELWAHSGSELPGAGVAAAGRTCMSAAQRRWWQPWFGDWLLHRRRHQHGGQPGPGGGGLRADLQVDATGARVAWRDVLLGALVTAGLFEPGPLRSSAPTFSSSWRGLRLRGGGLGGGAARLGLLLRADPADRGGVHLGLRTGARVRAAQATCEGAGDVHASGKLAARLATRRDERHHHCHHRRRPEAAHLRHWPANGPAPARGQAAHRATAWANTCERYAHVAAGPQYAAGWDVQRLGPPRPRSQRRPRAATSLTHDALLRDTARVIDTVRQPRRAFRASGPQHGRRGGRALCRRGACHAQPCPLEPSAGRSRACPPPRWTLA